MKNYTEYLESNIFELISILTHASLWNFLSDGEREKVGKILQSSQETKEKFQEAL